MKKLPVLLSIPHGGWETPPEILDGVRLSADELFDDSDAFTVEIYSQKNKVEAEISTPVARAFVDLNREQYDLPPRNPDGVVKTHTCYNKRIYKSDHFLEKSSKTLLENYYVPYHRRIQELLKLERVSLGLDCHSMAAIGPDFSPDQGKERPLFCIGTNRGKACSLEKAELMQKSLAHAFGLSISEVQIDVPFSGGFITRNYGDNPKPWMQIEMNRKLYLTKGREKDSVTIQKLNDQFLDALANYFNFS